MKESKGKNWTVSATLHNGTTNDTDYYTKKAARLYAKQLYKARYRRIIVTGPHFYSEVLYDEQAARQLLGRISPLGSYPSS